MFSVDNKKVLPEPHGTIGLRRSPFL